MSNKQASISEQGVAEHQKSTYGDGVTFSVGSLSICSFQTMGDQLCSSRTETSLEDALALVCFMVQAALQRINDLCKQRE